MHYDSINEITERQIRCVLFQSLVEISTVRPPVEGHFGACLLLDKSDYTECEVLPVAEALLNAGMVYLLSWGPGAAEVELWFDKAIVARNPKETEMNVVMTLSLKKESMDEAIWHFLNVCFPADDYWQSCQSELIICVGRPDQYDQVVSHLRNQRQLTVDICGCDDDDAT